MLEKIFQELNRRHFSGELPLPRLTWNSRLTSSAGRFKPGHRLLYLERPALIEIAAYLRDIADSNHHIQDTLLHEMVHYYLWHQRRPYGHTKEFHTILKRVGARRYNHVPKHSGYKHLYECTNCKVQVPTRRKIGNSACAICCKKWNGGRYSEKYLLRRVDPANSLPLALEQKKEPLAAAPLFSVSEVIQKLEVLKQIFSGKS